MAGSGVVLRGHDLPQQIILNAASGVANNADRTDVTWSVRPAVRATKRGTMLQVSIVMAEIPYAWPNVTASTNMIRVTHNAIVYDLALATGRTNIFELFDNLVAVLNGALAGTPFVSAAQSRVDAGRNRIVLVPLVNFTISRESQFSTCAPIVGIEPGGPGTTYNLVANTPFALEPSNVAYLGSKVYIRSNNIHVRNMLVRPNNMPQPSDVLAECPIGYTVPFGLIQADLTNQRQFVAESELQQINLRLTNRLGESLQLPPLHRDWTVTLRFDVVEPFEAVNPPSDPGDEAPSQRRKTAI
jgi:hypothetical protein